MSNTNSSSSNLLSPLVDALCDCGTILWKLLTNNPNRIDWKEEFLALGIKNKNDETPRYLSCKEDNYRIEYLFYLPKGLTVEHVEKAISRVATVSKKQPEYISVERYLDKAKVVVDKGVFEKELFKFEDLDFSCEKGSFKIPVGYYLKDGKLTLLCLDLSSSTQCNVLIGGTAGYGKTNISKSILSSVTKFYSPDFVKYIICDLKGTELPLFTKTQHCISYTDSVHETCTVIKDLLKEMADRYSLFIEAKCKDFNEYTSRGNKLPRLILFIDEFADLTLMAEAGDIDKEVITDLARLLQKGRAAGITCIFALQTAKATLIPTEIRNNMPVTIGLGCRDGNQSKSITGDSTALADLRERPAGMCMVFGLPRFNPTTLIKSIYMPEGDNELSSILKPYFKNSESKVISNAVADNVITKKVSGFDLNKSDLFAEFQPKPKKKRKPHGSKKVKLDKFDDLN